MAEPEKERAEGQWEEVKGKVKKGVGDVTGDESMRARGAAEEEAGRAHQEAAKAGAQAQGEWEKTKGKVKGAVGDLTDDESMQAEGEAEQLKGEARKRANQ